MSPIQSGIISLAVNKDLDLIISSMQMRSVNCKIIHNCQMLGRASCGGNDEVWASGRHGCNAALSPSPGHSAPLGLHPSAVSGEQSP